VYKVSLPATGPVISIPPILEILNEQFAPIVCLEGACADEVVLDVEFRRRLRELIEQALKLKKSSLQSSVMPQFSIFDPRERPFDRPACPKCGCPMWLASIEPDKTDHDKRRHECPRCQYEEETVVRYR
jgi:ribosomal protein S27AE